MKPDWVDYYLGLAWIVKERSPDTTKHGCVLTLKDYSPVSFGYNGYARGINPPDYMKVRPHKLFLISHAEENALLFCDRADYAFCTGAPCSNCLSRFIQKGISRVHIIDRTGWSTETEEEKERVHMLLHQSQIEVVKFPLKAKWMTQALEPKQLIFNPTKIY